jgi:hypothetical protein
VFKCPVCGAADGACTDGQPYRYPVEMEDLDIMANPKATETVKARMPQQFVREGRGVAGYKGNVEVYDPNTGAAPERTKRIIGGKSRSPKEDK